MSATYNLEPPPTAKVLLQTSSGDVELEIFAKQTPLASRNFLQLCLDGYFNDTIFHRLVPGFVLQGGDPTGTGDGGEAIYPGGTFADEFHSRLKFNRRGLLGMANNGKDDNGSQFFITLGKTDELNGKNTMFGRVVGDTIYNVMKMAEAELVDVEGSDRPLYPTKITGAEILVNPFNDMVKRVIESKASTEVIRAVEKKKKPKKGGKGFLSFGDDEGNEVDVPIGKKVRYNTKIIDAKRPDIQVTQPKQVALEKKGRSARLKETRSPSPAPRTPMELKTQLPLPPKEVSDSDGSSPKPEQIRKVSSTLEKTNAQIAELKMSMKRSSAPVPAEPMGKKSALEEMIPKNAMRGRKRKHGNAETALTDESTLHALNEFRAKLNQGSAKSTSTWSSKPQGSSSDAITKTHAEGGTEEGVEEASLCDLHFIAHCQSCKSWDQPNNDNVDKDGFEDNGWMSHALTFEKDRLGKDLTWKQKNEQELVVIDPRQKAQQLKEGKVLQRESNRAGQAGDKNHNKV